MYARQTEIETDRQRQRAPGPPELELLAVLSNTQWVFWEPAQVLGRAGQSLNHRAIYSVQKKL